MIGVCCDARGALSAPSLRQIGVLMPGHGGGVRQVLLHDERVFAYLETVANAGYEVAVVAAGESFETDDYGAELAWYAQELGRRGVDPTLWLIGNEPNAQAGSTSSWVMEPSAYIGLWNSGVFGIRSVLPDAPCYVGGLLGRSDVWLEETMPWLEPKPSGLDLHYPGIGGDNAKEALRLYARLWQLPLSVMEWSYVGRGVTAAQVVAYLQLIHRYATHSAVFSYHRVPGVEYMSLTGPRGVRRKAWYNFRAAYRATVGG
jgi:hypothetical protein